ncbi:MAG TPA: PIG-L family deacetylase [Acidobacteriaceae bacterium]|nr:PIG-L family deacetylase [Acidobacteriaceae bacterium]
MSRRLLCVTAHPDDESGAFGGALMLAAQAGAETTVLCFTDGQAAHFRGTAAGDQELGALRRREMAAACGVLGVTRCEVLHFPDGELYQSDFQQMVSTAVERMRTLRPHVVLTFGGDGGVNLHRDHAVVSAVATMAFHWAGRAEMFPGELSPWSPQKLYYVSTPFVSVRDRPELTATAATTPWSLSIELGDLADRKLEAFRKHTSQQGVLQRVGEHVRKAMQVERYLLVARRGVNSVTVDTAMFAGVSEDRSE